MFFFFFCDFYEFRCFFFLLYDAYVYVHTKNKSCKMLELYWYARRVGMLSARKCRFFVQINLHISFYYDCFIHILTLFDDAQFNTALVYVRMICAVVVGVWIWKPLRENCIILTLGELWTLFHFCWWLFLCVFGSKFLQRLFFISPLRNQI